jgi:hypothetical protein
MTEGYTRLSGKSRPRLWYTGTMETTAEQPKIELGVDTPETDVEAPMEGAPLEAAETRNENVEVAVPAPAAASVPASRPAAIPKDETTVRVEKVLEEGLGETYSKLPPKVRLRFRQEGEKATREIVGMVASLKVKAGRVLVLLTRWLRVIPHVNAFFLSQEAKIKTDKIVALGDEEKAKRGMTA